MRAYKVPQPVVSMLNESEIVCKTGGDFFAIYSFIKLAGFSSRDSSSSSGFMAFNLLISSSISLIRSRHA